MGDVEKCKPVYFNLRVDGVTFYGLLSLIEGS